MKKEDFKKGKLYWFPMCGNRSLVCKFICDDISGVEFEIVKPGTYFNTLESCEQTSSQNNAVGSPIVFAYSCEAMKLYSNIKVSKYEI